MLFWGIFRSYEGVVEYDLEVRNNKLRGVIYVCFLRFLFSLVLNL